ncbi:hypothetical protein HanOQP8_Chr17g0658621 [Helianthus annuus]|nr:hypothetical protein HanOQP8_Chr17g0658621 [Helianthus annuus]
MYECQIGEWSLFDFVDPPRNTALRSADRAIGEQEPDVLRIHLEQFLLPAVPADMNAHVSQLPPSGGSSVSIAETKKPSRIKITGRKVITTRATTSPVAVSIYAAPEGATAVSAPTGLVSPQPVPKKRMMMPPLSAFKQSRLLTPCLLVSDFICQRSFAEVQVGGGSSMPLSSVEIVPSAAGGQIAPLADLISHASVVAEMPTTSAAGESTSARDTTVSDTWGSSSGFVDDVARLTDDLYFLTVYWDPYAQDKRYQPKWKIAESSRLVFPLVVHHWIERAYPPVESAYVEGLDNENLMNATMVDGVSQPRRLVEIRRRWMHDNNELHQARITIQELMDEKYHLESQLQAAGLRESRFVSEKNKAEEDLKRVTANLAEKG